MKYGIHSLVFKQCAIILIGFTIVFGVLFGATKYLGENRISQLLMERGTEISEKNVNHINMIFSEAELIGKNALNRLGEERPDQEKLPETLKSLLSTAREKVPETVALVIAMDSAFQGEFMRLAYYSSDSIRIIEGSSYEQKEWFLSAKNAGKPMWQEPFIGDFVNEPIAVYTIPFFMPNKEGKEVFAGVIAVDLSIAFLQDALASIKVDNMGYAFMLSSKNTIVAHPNRDWVFKESLQSLVSNGNVNLFEFEQALQKERKGVVIGTSVSGAEACIYYMPMMMDGWTFGIVWPAQKFFERQRTIVRYFALIILAGYLVMFVLVLVVSFHVARPLNRMSRIAHDIGKGNFTVQIPRVPGKDEIAQFSMAFNKMRESLEEYVRSLKNMTDKNLRMESELNVARDIQLGVLPKDENEEFMRDGRHELKALLQPARGVGGDFYDFYALDEDHIVFTVADVSGKGVPAALFMMSVRTQLKSLALAHLSLDKVFNMANERLCHKNDSNMFVTVWMGILDLRTGHVEFCNAGHNPPVVCHRDGTVEFVANKPGLVLAGMPEMKYKIQSLDLLQGDTIFLYTDGVTEAANEKENFFGNDRLLDVLKKSYSEPIDNLCDFVMSHIKKFVGTADQFDDITMLALKFNEKK